MDCIVIGSATQAVARVALRVKLGGHQVPKDDIRRRFDRSRRHFLADNLPLADEWACGTIKHRQRSKSPAARRTLDQLHVMLTSNNLHETPPREMSEVSTIVLEASRVATEKMLDYYHRMGIQVMPEMTLAPEDTKRTRYNSVIRLSKASAKGLGVTLVQTLGTWRDLRVTNAA